MSERPFGQAGSGFLLSVIVPSRNPGGHIHELFDWAVPIQGVEIIVVDDGSSDGSSEVLLGHVAQHPTGPIRLARGPGQGAGAARNAGLVAAQGEFVAFSDVDDLTHLTVLQRGAKVCAQMDADVLVCGYAKVDLASGTRQTFPATSLNCGSGLRGTESLLNRATVWGKVFRRRFLLENTVAFPHVLGAEDVRFSYEVAVLRPKTILRPEVAYEYRVARRNQLTSSRSYFSHGANTLFEMLRALPVLQWQKSLLAFTIMSSIPHVSRGIGGWQGLRVGLRLGARCFSTLGPHATCSGIYLGIRNRIRRGLTR